MITLGQRHTFVHRECAYRISLVSCQLFLEFCCAQTRSDGRTDPHTLLAETKRQGNWWASLVVGSEGDFEHKEVAATLDFI